MGFGNAIVDVLRRLVGMPKEPQVVSLEGHAPVTVDDEDPDDDDGHGEPPTVEDEWDDMQAFVARCEAEAVDLAGIDVDDPVTFWLRYLEIEVVPEGERPGTRESRAKAAGFSDLRHWDSVAHYCQIKWSELVDDADGPEIRLKASFNAAKADARRRRSP